MIIARYLRREIVRPLLPILAVLVAVFAGYSVAESLADTTSGLLPADTVVSVVALKSLIALEVLIPVALYVSVVLSFGRLYGDSEFIAASAVRITPGNVLVAVLTVSGCLALAVAGLSLAVRPWAYASLHRLADHAASVLDVGAMQPGTFYTSRHGDRVVFFSQDNGPGSPARDVFVQTWRGDEMEIIHAAAGYALAGKASDGGSRIDLRDAHVYDLGLGARTDDQALTARSMILDPDPHDEAAQDYSAVTAGSLHLARSDAAPDVAELQWRLSTPVSTLLLGLLGIPMSRARPRQSRYAKLAAAVLLYFGYYMLFTSARTWVQHGAIAAFPGIWWVPALLGLFLVATLYGPVRQLG